MWTKGLIVSTAFAECGVADYDFDLTPEEKASALNRLDAMMATWEAKGIHVGYLMPASPSDSSLDSESGLPDRAVETVYLNLAQRLAPGIGKTLSPQTLNSARDGYDQLLIAAAYPQSQQLPDNLPRGAGNRQWRASTNPFFPTPTTDPLPVDGGGGLQVLPE